MKEKFDVTTNETNPSQLSGLDDYMERGIKEIITERPEIEAILEDYDIGCGPCTVGQCLLKDIVEVHAIPPEEELEMIGRIHQVIDPNSPFKANKIRKKKSTPKVVNFSPPMQKLVDEHKFIKRLVAHIPHIIASIDLGTEEGRQRVLDGIDFIRNYADRYHHAKEEDLLFKYFDEDLDIIQAMYEDHKNARDHVKNIVMGIETRNRDNVITNLSAYQELLTDHIRKEDDILYPWMDRSITTAQVGTLFSAFNEVDQRFGDAPTRYEKFVNQLERNYQPNEE